MHISIFFLLLLVQFFLVQNCNTTYSKFYLICGAKEKTVRVVVNEKS